MKTKELLRSKNPQINHITTPWFSVFLHKGQGSFSIHQIDKRDHKLTLIIVNKGYGVTIETQTLPVAQVEFNRCRLFIDGGSPATFSYKGSKSWEFLEIRIAQNFLKELPASLYPAWGKFTKEALKNKPSILADSNLYYRNAYNDVAYALLSQQFTEPNVQLEYCKIKLKEVLLYILNETKSAGSKDIGITNKQYLITAKAQKLLEKQQTTRSFTIQSLALAIGTNETTLKQAFKKVTGTTVYKYYLQQQMKLAQQLLQQGHAVGKVALKVGYSNISHFSYQFKNLTGINPLTIKTKV